MLVRQSFSSYKQEQRRREKKAALEATLKSVQQCPVFAKKLCSAPLHVSTG